MNNKSRNYSWLCSNKRRSSRGVTVKFPNKQVNRQSAEKATLFIPGKHLEWEEKVKLDFVL